MNPILCRFDLEQAAKSGQGLSSEQAEALWELVENAERQVESLQGDVKAWQANSTTANDGWHDEEMLHRETNKKYKRLRDEDRDKAKLIEKFSALQGKIELLCVELAKLRRLQRSSPKDEG